MIGFNYKKAVQLLTYFADRSGGTINKRKAIKLVWLSDRLHLRKYGRTITGDVYFALPYGPVASNTRDLIESYELLSQTEAEYVIQYLGKFTQYEYSAIQVPDYDVLSQTDQECISLIFKAFGLFNHYELSEMSHLFPEWKKYESSLKREIASRFEIDQIDFFDNVNDAQGLFMEDDEYIAISKSIYQESIGRASLF